MISIFLKLSTLIQSGVIKMGLSENKLIYCSRKTSLLKLNEQYEVSLRSMTNDSDAIFVEKFRSIEFPDYSNHTCVTDVYYVFISYL